MNKTKRIVALAAALMVLTVSALSAQASNTDATTFGRFGTDVDNFLSTSGYGTLDLSSVFAYTRIGTGIAKGKLDLGFATKLGNIYVGLYYGGLTQSDGTVNTNAGKLGEFEPANISVLDGTDPKIIKFAQDDSVPFGTIGVLVGVGGIGYRVKYTDGITNTASGASPWTQTRTGTSTVSLDVGGLPLGPFKSVGVDVDIVQNSYASATGGTTNIQYEGNTVGTTATPGPNALLNEPGTYVAPKIKVGFGFGDLFSLDNDLSFRIYGSWVPGDLEGKVDAAYAGNAIYAVTYDTVSGNDQIGVIWNKKFYLEDTITPSIAGTINATDTLSVGWKAKLPITISIENNALSAAGTTGTDEVTTVSDFYKDGTFGLDFKPTIQAAVKFQPAKVLDVHAGLEVQVIDWALSFYASEEVEASTDVKDVAVMTGVNSYGYSYSTKSDTANSTVYAPKLGYAIGFTVNMGPAALDFTFANVSDPTVPGAFYSAVGQALGSSTTSVVLSFKL